MGTQQNLDLDKLPYEAKKEILDFYQFLVKKYAIKKVKDKNRFFEIVKAHSFKLPEDYKFNRESLHGR